MKKTFLLTLLLVNIITGFSQELIKEASLSFKLPNDKWELKGKQDKNGKQVYFFKRESIKDKLGRDVIPNISIIVEDVDKKLDVVTFSALKRGQVNFEVDEVFIHEKGIIDFKNAIGYKGRYTDKFGEHTIYVLHAINKKKGLQIFFDVLTGVFEELDSEFKFTLKSIKKG